jgi:hypothetical protein
MKDSSRTSLASRENRKAKHDLDSSAASKVGLLFSNVHASGIAYCMLSFGGERNKRRTGFNCAGCANGCWHHRPG